MKIELNTTESEEYFYNSLCNGMGYVCSGYGLQIDYLKEDYQKAKLSLQEREPLKGICREDVWMEILRNGGKLTLIDIECEGENDASITMKDVHEKVQLTDAQRILDMVNENDDAETADCIIQTVFYGEIIFG